jgi:hypothetical protein
MPQRQDEKRAPLAGTFQKLLHLAVIRAVSVTIRKSEEQQRRHVHGMTCLGFDAPGCYAGLAVEPDHDIEHIGTESSAPRSFGILF